MKTTTSDVKRFAEWGHWGITFGHRVDGEYAPRSIEGTLYFPVGNRGPCDGTIGSPERKSYQDVVREWIDDGVVPQRLTKAEAK